MQTVTRQETGIDWDGVRKRIGAGESGLLAALSPESDVVQSVFRQRARELARRKRHEEAVEASPVLIFQVAGDRCAVELSHVAEVSRLRRCTPVPGGPPELTGVANNSGAARSVLNLGVMLGHSPASSAAPAVPGSGAPETFCVVLQHGERRLRFMIERPDRIEWIDLDSLTPPPPGVGELPTARYVRGIHNDGTFQLNVDALFAHPAVAGGEPWPAQHR